MSWLFLQQWHLDTAGIHRVVPSNVKLAHVQLSVSLEHDVNLTKGGFQTLAGNMKPGSYVQPCRCNGSSWVTATDAVGWPAMADTARQWLHWQVQYWQIMPLSCCTRLECRVIRYWPASCLCGMLQQYAIWTPFWEDFKPDYSFCRLF